MELFPDFLSAVLNQVRLGLRLVALYLRPKAELSGWA
jgi:hypothetical protein